MRNINDLMEKAIEFHGHSCPGLAIGVLVSKYILEQGNSFSIDEELVAIVENDNCSVDAIQRLLGTTFGKGNLIFKDYGKNNYTFYNRTSEKAINLRLKNDSKNQQAFSREERIDFIINSDPNDIFNIRETEFNPPQEAQIYDRIICENCQDPTMSTRIKIYNEKKICIPCYLELETKEK